MNGLLNDRATLYRRMPDAADGSAQQQHELDGTVGDCAQFVRDQPEGDRECFFAELADGKRLSAEEIDRIAVNEGA